MEPGLFLLYPPGWLLYSSFSAFIVLQLRASNFFLCLTFRHTSPVPISPILSVSDVAIRRSQFSKETCPSSIFLLGKSFLFSGLSRLQFCMTLFTFHSLHARYSLIDTRLSAHSCSAGKLFRVMPRQVNLPVTHTPLPLCSLLSPSVAGLSVQF